VIEEDAGGRGVAAAGFRLLRLIGDLEPVRLVDLARTSGLPRPTVYRLLRQLAEVGAVQRDGPWYWLGASLLGLGERATSQHRLRAVSRRPLAELASYTPATVLLSAPVDGQPILLEVVEARDPIGFAVGSPVQPGTALAQVQESGSAPLLAVDPGTRR